MVLVLGSTLNDIITLFNIRFFSCTVFDCFFAILSVRREYALRPS